MSDNEMFRNQQKLIEAGYTYDVARALAENNHNLESVKHLSSFEVFDMFLTWNGILGYTSLIIEALDNSRKQQAKLPF